MDNNYSIKEFIEHAMDDIKEKIDTIHTDVKEIKAQTTRTNGRVSKLEWWRSGFIWVLGAMWTLALIVIPLLYKAFYKNLDYKIKDAVVQAVDNKVNKIEYEK